MRSLSEDNGIQFENIARAALESALDGEQIVNRDFIYRSLVDFIGCAAGGLSVPFVRQVREKLLAIPPHTAVCIGNQRVPTRSAAFANALAAHSCDFDDTQLSTTVHASSVIWSCLFAVNLGATSGMQVGTAYQAGLQFLADLSPYIVPNHLRHGWHATGTLGTLGGIVALSRLRQSSAEQAWRSIGTAGSLMGGLRRNNHSSLKALHAGRAAEGATLAFELGDLQGFVGEPSVAAIGEAFGCQASKNDDGSSIDLVRDVAFKAYPTCSGTHPAIDGALELANPEQPPDHIEVIVPALVEEETHTRWPASVADARFSLPYCVALAFVRRRIDEDSLSSGLRDQAVKEVFDRVTVKKTAGTRKEEAYEPRAVVEATWKRETASVSMSQPRGDTASLGTTDLEEKMLSLSRWVWAGWRQVQILKAIRSLATGGPTEPLTEVVAKSDPVESLVDQIEGGSNNIMGDQQHNE